MKATVFSGAPFAICEAHPHCVPYVLALPAADFINGEILRLLVEDGHHGLYVDQERGYIPIPDDGVGLAERTVSDILQAQFLYDSNAHPAVFFLPGDVSISELKAKHQALLDKNMAAQRLWFQVLVRRADASFNKNHNLAEISDLHRSAALFLGLQRDWCDKDPSSMIQCPACYTLVRQAAAICFACKAVVNPEKAAKITFLGQDAKK